MKIKKRYQIPLVALMFQTTTVARFGPARLVRKADGRHELIGGMAEHHAAAREWCSLFAPEIVFASGQTTTRKGKTKWLDCQRHSHRQTLAA